MGLNQKLKIVSEACRIKATIEITIGTSEVQPDLFGHLLQCFQALWEQDHVGLVDGRYRDRG